MGAKFKEKVVSVQARVKERWEEWENKVAEWYERVKKSPLTRWALVVVTAFALAGGLSSCAPATTSRPATIEKSEKKKGVEIVKTVNLSLWNMVWGKAIIIDSVYYSALKKVAYRYGGMYPLYDSQIESYVSASKDGRWVLRVPKGRKLLIVTDLENRVEYGLIAGNGWKVLRDPKTNLIRGFYTTAPSGDLLVVLTDPDKISPEKGYMLAWASKDGTNIIGLIPIRDLGEWKK
ncbi:MAG: hypothetical protein GXN92_03160 [Candidatus Micrarchaeota archaeon]|nr:hypothetical protein [Candidatus Micrarchaeota archaeon]